ncbi:ribosomal biogenesis regulatory protein [Neohortaea acidophila]|uniref:Ribosome biogenesis regulatory protein n=1 Tax=Neohortaea acidophila TaxID=245834 RepID=A0A6A6PKZ4_9PEZI|nr:ribosomal biogenesis regulatory protein [Neohortaea acidophila]KAF2480699.1 ribosomal biogenesis regulatory protein [Neohortaea acidophila]
MSTHATTTMVEGKAQPYTFDLGHLLCNDPNPLAPLPEESKEAVLAATARDCAQALINQLLTVCPISRAPDDGNLQLTVPPPDTQLPREKPVPKEKEKTRWAKFAEKKGIKAKRKDGKLVYDEAKGDWVPKYGYKGKKTDAGDNWLVEVDEKAERERNDVADGARKKAKKQR